MRIWNAREDDVAVGRIVDARFAFHSSEAAEQFLVQNYGALSEGQGRVPTPELKPSAKGAQMFGGDGSNDGTWRSNCLCYCF